VIKFSAQSFVLLCSSLPVHQGLHIDLCLTTPIPACKQGDDIEEKMRSKEEVEKMFEATKKELDKIVKRLMLTAQLVK